MFQKSNKTLIAIALIVLTAIIIPIIFIPETVVGIIGTLYNFITLDLAWLFLLIGVGFTICTIILLTTKFGDIKLGGRDAQPHYKTFTWISMNLCSALAAGILIFGMCEWAYYVHQTPFGIEPASVEAYEYASAYGMFHWGFAAWAFYLIPGIAIGYLYWNKKIGDLRVSVLCGNILDGDAVWKKFLKLLIDSIIVLGYFMAIMTTVGIGTPVLGELLSDLTGIPNDFSLKIGVIFIFCLFFMLSTSKTIAKGMALISNFNVKLSIIFFAFVLIVGDTAFILNNLVMSVGLNIREFVRMSFNTDAIGQTGFVQGWTIFYWAWYVALTFICGIWIARTSYGRSFKEIAIANCIYAPLACWITFGILGNYGMAQELFHGLEISSVIGSIGNNGVTLLILNTMPLSKLCIFIFLILIFFNLATTCTANATSLSMYTSIGLESDEEPNTLYKTFWSFLFLIIPVGILFLEKNIDGLNVLSTVQSMITISSLPMFIALITLFISFYKALKEDINSGEIVNSVDENKVNNWK